LLKAPRQATEKGANPTGKTAPGKLFLRLHRRDLPTGTDERKNAKLKIGLKASFTAAKTGRKKLQPEPRMYDIFNTYCN
jgi:hypothetical protein